jgi:tetratricopeptide (TPR) repeat protein
MSNDWSTTQSSQLQDWNIASPATWTVGSSFVLLLLGIGVVWQWTRQQHRQQSSFCSNATPQVLQWISEAKALEHSQQYEGAIAIYDQALNHYPQDYRLWHERGLALAKLQRFEAANASYDSAYKLRPDHRDLAHERGDALLELERYEEAILALNVYLRYEPNSAHVLTDRGYALHQLGRYDEALRSLNQALTYAQRDQDSRQRASYYRIASLQQSGQLETALRESQQAMQRYPEKDWFKTQHEALLKHVTSEMGGNA